jgi:23S rRNA (uridine2552-2'-O)-methyltransferase
MKKKGSSGRWLAEHHRDPYVKMARDAGYRSRAVFKLDQIQKKDRLIKQGMTIVDLGAAPGGWSQLSAKLLKGSGRILALDILPMDPVEGVDFIQGDFRESAVLEQLELKLAGERVDLVLSDMAPNISGIDASDQARAMYLVELALEFCQKALKPGGNLLIKVFQGEGFDAYLKAVREAFATVQIRKPDASRERSREVYLLARNYRLV